MSAGSSQDQQLAAILKRLEAIESTMNSSAVNQNLANVQLKDDVVKAVGDAIARTKAEKKTKKSVEAGAAGGEAGGDADGEDKKDAAVKHPDFPLLTKTAWKLKKSNDDNIKLGPYVRGLYQHYKPHLISFIGEGTEQKVLGREDYKAEVAKKPGRKAMELATLFETFLWKQLSDENRLKDVAARLMADYTKKHALLEGGAVSVVVHEGASAAEAAGATKAS